MDGKLSVLTFSLMLCVAVTQAGVSYIRWGRTSCPSGNVLLYKGYIVGNHYLGKGNGGNFLCTTQEPLFVRGQAGFQEWGGRIFGVELEKNANFNNLFLADNVPGGELHNQDMVCVRCHVPDASDVFMLPGRPDCQKSGYDLLYKGFIVSEGQYSDRSPHEYICLDESPEGRVGGTGDDNQGFLYPTQVECGSLPCNPYINGMEEPCAVCAY